MSCEATPVLARWTAALHRVAAFGHAAGGDSDDGDEHDDHLRSDALLAEATTALERAADEAAAAATSTLATVSDECMSLCADLLETLPASSPAMRALTAFVSSVCLAEDNRQLAVCYGIASTCVLLLRLHDRLGATTLYHVLDLASTLAATSATARAQLRPCVPSVVRVMRAQEQQLLLSTSPATLRAGQRTLARVTMTTTTTSPLLHDVRALELLFGCSYVLGVLAMLDHDNCELIAQCGGVQALVDAYRIAYDVSVAADNHNNNNNNNNNNKVAMARRTTCCTLTRNGDAAAALHRVAADVCRWSKDTLLKLCHAAATAPPVRAALTTADYGAYGTCIAVDELKWAVTFECRRLSR